MKTTQVEGGRRGRPRDVQRDSRLMHARAAKKPTEGAAGPEGSVAKVVATEHNQRVYDFCLGLLGEDGMLYDACGEARPIKELPWNRRRP